MQPSQPHRRSFLRSSTLVGIGLVGVAKGLTSSLIAQEPPTPSQTTGPFYPKPAIEKQPHFDADLTRLASDGPLAEGELHVVCGQLVDTDGNPLANATVELWQACHSGRYNHPQDRNAAPLDPNFQYWARIQTGEDGTYRFKTIVPGKYPGRTPHIHYRILADGHDELVTQMFFESHMDLNRRDGIYKSLTEEQQQSVTVAFTANSSEENLPTGDFRIVLGKRAEPGSTPPM